MHTDGIVNELDTFASWPRAFTFQELLDFADSEIDCDMFQRALLNDCRFIRLGPKDGYFVAVRALFRWFSCLSLRLAQAGRARLDERQLAMAMSALRAAGRWDVPLPPIIEFGQRFGFCGRAWTPQQYVFPVAKVLSFTSDTSARRALDALEGLAEAQSQELSPEEVLIGSVQKALSGLPDKLAHVLRAREGLFTGTSMTLEEIGRPLGVTRERVRQLERKAWSQIHHARRKAPLIVALLRDIMARHGRLIFDMQGPEAWARRFVWKCVGVPQWDVPETGWVVLGASPDQAAVLDPSGWSPELIAADTIADHLDSEGQLCLVDADLRVIAGTIAEFPRERATKAQRATKGQRVYLALRAIGKPAHYTAVTEVYNRLFPDDPSSENTIHAALSYQKHGVVWIGIKGTYALEEWGYERPSNTLFDAVAEIVEKQYEATGTPVPFAVIAAEMGKLRRVVRSSSLTIAAHCNPRLRRVSSDSFVPRMPDEQGEEEIPEDELDKILQEFEEHALNGSRASPAKGERIAGVGAVPERRGRFARLTAIARSALLGKRAEGGDDSVAGPSTERRQDGRKGRTKESPPPPGSQEFELMGEPRETRVMATTDVVLQQQAGIKERAPRSDAAPLEDQAAGARRKHIIRPPGERREQTKALLALLHSKGLEVIDERPRGGYLWVIGGKELYSFLSPRGFIWEPRGAPATGNRAGWYLP